MRRQLRFISAIPTIIINKFKKSTLDNFVAGLLFGAIFSLIVNIVTVKIQEDVAKQRALEALEREIRFHALTVSSFIDSDQNLPRFDNSYQINADSIFALRYKTRIWDSTEVDKYLFELDPETSALISVYYDTIIHGVNKRLSETEATYRLAYERCRPFYTLIYEKEKETIEFCNELSRTFSSLQVASAGIDLVMKDLNDITQLFHPTKDRLESPWLKLLLGSDSVELLK